MSLYSSNIYSNTTPVKKKEKRRRGKITVYNIYGRFCLPILPSTQIPPPSNGFYKSRPRRRGRAAPAVSLPLPPTRRARSRSWPPSSAAGRSSRARRSAAAGGGGRRGTGRRGAGRGGRRCSSGGRRCGGCRGSVAAPCRRSCTSR